MAEFPDSATTRVRRPSRHGEADIAILAALMLAIAIAVAWTHWRALSAQAICFDDPQYIGSNRLVRNPSWDSLAKIFGEVLEPTAVKGYYQPLSLASLMLDAAISEKPSDLATYHRTSLVLHVANTLLIVFLLFQLFEEPVPAALVGLLFGVHPLTVECIPWSAERKTLLAIFFALISLIAYVRSAKKVSGGWMIASGAGFVLSVLSKPTTLPLPFVMLLLDYWPLHRFDRRRVLEKTPLFALAAVFGIITIVSQSRTAGVGAQGQNILMTALLTTCHNIVFYLKKIVWPTGLTPHYPYPDPFDFSNPSILAGVIGTVILISALILVRRKTRAFSVGFLIFFIALLPVMQLIGFTFVICSDKYTYFPMIGVLLLACWGMKATWTAPHSTRATIGRVLLIGLTISLAYAASEQSRKYLLAWRDSESLHRHMLDLAPRSGMITDLLASDLLGQGKSDEALELQQKAVNLDPSYPVSRQNLAASLLSRGRIEEARIQFEEAIKLNPAYCLPYVGLGSILASQGKVDEALNRMNKALEIEPTLAEVHYNVATLLAQQRKFEDAAKHFVQAIFYKPNYPEAHNNLGILLANTGNMQKAAENFQQAVRLRPNYLQARGNLARALDRLGKRDEALREYIEITKLDPSDESARRAVEAMAGRLSKTPATPNPPAERGPSPLPQQPSP